MTVIENKAIMTKAMIIIEVNFKAGVLIIKTYSICPDNSKLKKIPKMIPLIIEITILINISRNMINLKSNTDIPIALNILNTSASYLHFP